MRETPHRTVGFFPGLGSRDAYRNLGRSLLDSGVPEVVGIYHDAARALGSPGRPEKLLMVAENMPDGKLEQQGFIGAALLVHNLALAAFLRAAAAEAGAPLDFVAYTGESFGIITSAVASGSLSVGDGVKIARAFTPLMLVAAEGDDRGEPFARALAACLPESVRGKRLVREPSHVMALHGETEALADVLGDIGRLYPKADVEVHKLYSPHQTNIYVRAGVKAGFDEFMRRFPAVRTAELKNPTTFLAHSERMRGARRALDRFIEENDIIFKKPHTPVVSNNDAGLLTTAAEVRNGVLAMTDEIMASQKTVEIMDGLHPDVILELGLGNKSLRLLADNKADAPAMAYTGALDETDLLVRSVKLMDAVMGELEKLYTSGNRLENRHYAMLREIFRQASRNPFCERYVHRTLSDVVSHEMLQSDRDGSPAFYRFLEIFQHTYSHRGSIDLDQGELVVRARLKKRIVGHPESLGQAYAELQVLDAAGRLVERTSVNTELPEVVVFHFDSLADLGPAELARKTRILLETQPSARQIYDETLESLRIEDDGFLTAADGATPTAEQTAVTRVVYGYALFEVLRLHRPAVLAQSDHYLEGGDPLGWLVALAVSGSLTLADAVRLYDAHLRADTDAARLTAVLDRVLSRLEASEVPVISPEGIPLQSKKDLEASTRAVFHGGALDARVRRIHLNGNCQILSLGSALDPARVYTGPYRTDVVSVLAPSDLWKKRVNPALDAVEDRSLMALTGENEKVLRYAQGRRLLSSTVYAYVNIGEQIVGFGQGGSESMTIFVRKDGEERITVRKILSEALTTANWNPKGDGVMLPPFAKAKKQAEYLQALPDSVRPNFPEVFEVLERDIPVPEHLRQEGRGIDREVIYEMSYVEGEEVSRFIEKHSPPPAVVSRLYEQIFRVLNENVHSVGRVPAPGETLDISYFRKIEDRLGLCRTTAPRTFGPDLLDTERIVINGVPYLNSAALLQRFRQHPEYLEVLEPRFHSLVMGDTNTENIKMAHPEPLLRAQRLIEAEAPRGLVNGALAAITAESLGIRFLDPRSIGFKTDGADTRDDPMYDNKPWHNSVGHYDEIHYEQFKIRVRTGGGQTPRVDIEFTEGNPYQRAYRVRDVEPAGRKIDKSAAPQGMEDYFGPVMTAVYGLDDPESPHVKDDPYWLVRFVFMMGTHFTAMPPFHFQSELDGTLTDTYQTQRRPVAIYCEGIKWLNWALEMLEGEREEFLGLPVPPLPYRTAA
ncbi:ACP S-malonyltransferase [Streptomyces sp. NBC_01565]|uniref:ACP S-malonyltransferase n=1 Tax=Streptomyces sp. NBC_01565 TaxID=2975881 RepID=UPI002259F733|nr:ACP S-malonyltransferase [Streptomyces sp. NBC_01565]MCX4545542.1 ACP S-malonyltransferase [Streptomyces sp. NBC_01565]